MAENTTAAEGGTPMAEPVNVIRTRVDDALARIHEMRHELLDLELELGYEPLDDDLEGLTARLRREVAELRHQNQELRTAVRLSWGSALALLEQVEAADLLPDVPRS